MSIESRAYRYRSQLWQCFYSDSIRCMPNECEDEGFDEKVIRRMAP
jgi:hypothetical protein